MIETLEIATGQESNACTLISIGVMNAILTYDRLNVAALKKAHQDGLDNYNLLQQNGTYGDGIGESEAQKKYFDNAFNAPVEFHVRRSSTRDTLIKELIDNRNSMTKDGKLEEDFIILNGDLIGNLMTLLKENAVIDWSTANEETLKANLEESNEPVQPLSTQFKERLEALPNHTGITLRGDGHTVSVTKKDNQYYFYNSATGKLGITPKVEEMADVLADLFYSAQDVTLYQFVKKPQPQYDVKQTGQLTTNISLLPERDENDKREAAATQAQRVFTYLLDKLKDPTKKIALIYSANNIQAEQLHEEYKDYGFKPSDTPEILPDIGGGGQAAFFGELIPLINQKVLEDPNTFTRRIRILPIATSLSGGENKTGNCVTLEMINRDLNAIKQHLSEGYDVEGIPSRDGFAVGGNISKNWYNTLYAGVIDGDKLLSQGEYVQIQLKELAKNTRHELPKSIKEWTPEIRFNQFKDRLQQMRGLAGKTISEEKLHLLDQISQKLSSIRDIDEFNDTVVKIQREPDFKLLSKRESILSLKSPPAIIAFESIVENFRGQLESPSPGHK